MSGGAVSAELAVTDWFDPKTQPVRQGAYQVVPFNIGEVRYSHWNGKVWSYFARDLIDLPKYKGDGDHGAHMKWRGLAADPSKAGS